MNTTDGLTQNEIARGLCKIGLKAGDVALVHSAMRTLGHVDGGPGTVVAAFLDVLGESGTLVAPAFTFKHEATENPIIDPANDPSEMGAISEAARTWPGARRGTAYRHSFSAIGRRAEVITDVDPELSVFDLRSSFGVMLALNTQVVLLGVTYSSSTSHHFAEAVCDVPYRHYPVRHVRVRRADGSLVEQNMTDYQPKPSADGSYYGSRHADFNRLGRMLEEKGLVSVGAIGNAAVRRFAMRDLIDLARVEAEKDYNVFRTEEGDTGFTALTFGTIVISPPIPDGAGRPQRFQWCVMDPEKLSAPKQG
jgi:aminoglycoside 3-N-acetyltransferase